VERYAKRGGSREDLIQEASMGLFRAVDRFDWKRGLLFRTYAVHWLNQAFRSYLYDQSNTVRVPVYVLKAIKHINQATMRLGSEHATEEEIAAAIELTPRVVRSALAAAHGNYSLDRGKDGEEGSRLGDLLEDANAQRGYAPHMEVVSLEAGLERAMRELPDRDRVILEMRFGLGYDHECTLIEVANHFGISMERVRQIQARALSKLGTARLRKELDPFVN
jgi:RNA polymerase primary sigma factor